MSKQIQIALFAASCVAMVLVVAAYQFAHVPDVVNAFRALIIGLWIGMCLQAIAMGANE